MRSTLPSLSQIFLHQQQAGQEMNLSENVAVGSSHLSVMLGDQIFVMAGISRYELSDAFGRVLFQEMQNQLRNRADDIAAELDGQYHKDTLYIKMQGIWRPFAQLIGCTWHLCQRFWIRNVPKYLNLKVTKLLGIQYRKNFSAQIQEMLYHVWCASEPRKTNHRKKTVQIKRGNGRLRKRPRNKKRRNYQR